MPLARCREILGERAAALDDDQVLALRATLSFLADVAVELAGSRLRLAA